jgi:hypothetical protein
MNTRERLDMIRELPHEGVDFDRWAVDEHAGQVVLTIRMLDPDTESPDNNVDECNRLVKYLEESGLECWVESYSAGLVYVAPLLTAESKLLRDFDRVDSPNSQSIIAAGPLIRRGQGYLPYRVVLRVHGQDESGVPSELVSHRQMIPDGLGSSFRPSYDHGQYISLKGDYEAKFREAVALWAARVLDPNGLAPPNEKEIYVWTNARRASFVNFGGATAFQAISTPVTWSLKPDREQGVILSGPNGFEAAAKRALELARLGEFGLRLRR